MRSYILPGLAPSFLFVFVIFWGLVSRDSYGFYEKKEGKKGKMEKLRDETDTVHQKNKNKQKKTTAGTLSLL